MSVLEENPNSKKNKNKRTQIQQQVDSNERKLNETKNKIAEEGETLNLATLYTYIMSMKFIIYPVVQILNIMRIWAHIVYNGI